MGIVLGLIVFVLLPAAISWAFCMGVRVLSPVSNRRRRVAFAALWSGLAPIIVPLAVLSENGAEDGIVPFVVVVLIGGLMALLVGLPVAIRATRRDFPA